ncbi:MAG: hypothetical protein CME38_14380 [Haliea sp.]|nr:hypothetical protein [Haliea sp.]
MPEPQADVQAELMAEAFGFYADNILTKDYFEAVLEARLGARFAEQDAKFDKRFAEIDRRFAEVDKRFAQIDRRFSEIDHRFVEQDAKFESRFSRVEKTQFLHTWMLGIIFIVVVVPQVQVWLS